MSHNVYLNLLWDFIVKIRRSTQGTPASLGSWVAKRRGANPPSEGELKTLSPERSGAISPSDSVEASFPERSEVKESSSEIKASIPVRDGPGMPSEVQTSIPAPGGPAITAGNELEASIPVPTGPTIPSEIGRKASPYQLWALVIGINSYSNKHPLNGAVADADAIREYLESNLKVPKDQIANLRDQDATRSNIISAFERLRDDDRIKKEDPILIYYAGHGGQTNGGNTQALIPVDFAPEQVSPIPDRTVASLINGIASKRGNNITVILDCCHSGSGTRGDEADDFNVRGSELSSRDFPDGLDAHILNANPTLEPAGTRGLHTAEGFAVRGMKSHVLLAACSANEVAREGAQSRHALPGQPTLENQEASTVRGRFTTALLELLENVSVNQITYAEVLTKILPIEGQNPQCEGFYSNRILFDAKVSEPTHKAYDVRFEVSYILQAGKAQGITDGAEFTLYRDQKLEAPLGVMKVQGGTISSTILKPVDKGKLPDTFDNPAIAVRTGASEDPPTYEVRFDVSYILQAGKAHGITDGAEFTLYRDKKVALLDAPLGVMKAQDGSIDIFTTILKPVDEGKLPDAFDNPAIAVQTRVGASEDLLVYVPLEGQYGPIFEAIAQELSGNDPNPCRIRPVKEDEATLGIVPTGGNFTFNALDKQAKKYGFTCMPQVVDARLQHVLRNILRSAAHYHFHLNLNGPNNKIQNRIPIEFFPLKEERDEDNDIVMVQAGENMHHEGKIEYEVDEGTTYGMSITNKTPWDLYFCCFFFDHADFSITALTEVNACNTPHQKDFDLKRNQTVKIGHGDSSIGSPLGSYVPEGLDLTIGFLKFYFTSKAIDLSHIPQINPFDSTRGLKKATDRTPQTVWGTVLIPLIQRKGK